MLGFFEFLVIAGLVMYVARLSGKLKALEERVDEERSLPVELALSVSELRRRVKALEPTPAEDVPPSPAAGAAGPFEAAEPRAAIPPVRPVPATPAVPPIHPAPPLAAAPPPAARTVTAPPRPPAPAGAAPPPRKPFDWESLVGVKLFSWIAGVLLALAAIQFLRYSIDHGFLTTPIRMALGLATGAGLLVLCELKAARRYAVTANALDAAGIVILFSTLFAAHALWHLLGSPATFGLMILVTVVAVALSIHHDSLFIALLGLIGGFATPALLSTGEDRPISLFAYLLLLNAGLAWVALRRSWPVLSALSLVFTTAYQWGWVARFLTADKLPLALGIFLAFPLLGVVAPALARLGKSAGQAKEPGGGLFERTAAIAAALPLLFAAFAAAVPAYGARFGLLFGFLFVLDAGLTAVAAWRGPRILHPLAAGMSLLAFALWLGLSYRHDAWPAVLGFLALFVLFHLAAPRLVARLGRPIGRYGRRGALAAPVFLAAFPVLLYLEPAAAAPGLPFGVLFVLLAAVAGFALWDQEGPLHFLAAFFAIAAEAVWSAEHLTPERLLPGIALYAIFGLFYLGVPLLARRLGRRLEPQGSGAFLLLLSLGLLFFLAAGTLAAAALWGLALLLVILNAGLFLEAGTIRRPMLALAGTVLSWILIAVWWITVPLAASLVPALFLVAGFAVLGLGGNLWMSRRSAAAGSQGAGGGIHLALVGHAFLLFVATQKSLALPPWPLLGVLALLDLAIGVAALWMRRAALWIAALAASDVILVFWLPQAENDPWPTVALAAAAAVSALGLLWIALAHRVERGREPQSPAAPGAPTGAFSDGIARAAAGALFLGQLTAAITTFGPGAPLLPAAVAMQLASLVAILALAGPRGRPRLAPWSVATSAFAVAAWVSPRTGVVRPWWTDLAFAAVLYLPYLVFPPLLARRGEGARLRQPYLAAVLASVPFFFFARRAIVAGGLGSWIGVLPVAQAIALALLLAQLRRSEAAVAPLERDRGRLALVAGAVLAFVTAAIPLQLDREWITIGWALLAAALAWLFTRVPHRGLLWWTAGLLVAVFLRLAANPAVLSYHPRGGLPILNGYLYTYLVPAAAFFAAAWFLARAEDRLLAALPRLSALASAAAVVLLFLAVNIEIADYFSTGTSLTFGFLNGQAGLGEDLSYTLGWGLFAILLLIGGIVLRSRAARVAAILLLLAAALKGFLLDMSRLGGLYRVGSFAGLAVCLALVAVLIQKFVLAARDEEIREQA